LRRQVIKFIILFIIITPISLKASTDFDKMVKIEKGFFQAGCDKNEIVQHNRVGVKTVFLDTYWID
jgi:formylglycine-generating enzyme required for sulfatase activity